MNDSHPELRRLSPPPGGWERLLARRDAPRLEPWWPLVAGCASTLLLLVLVPPLKLEVPWTGGRLVGERSNGASVRPQGEQRVTMLPADAPGVQIFWLEDAGRR